MRVVLQRVREAVVRVGDAELGRVAAGFLLLVGFTHDDTPVVVDWMAEKVVGLRLFPDGDGRMNRDLAEAGGAILVVSQFTLFGDTGRGRRPSFIDAARPEVAIPLYERFITELRSCGATVATGEFGAEMQVTLVNDGPVTLILERSAG